MFDLMNNFSLIVFNRGVQRTARWCSDNHLKLNVDKTSEFMVDYYIFNPTGQKICTITAVSKLDTQD